MATPPSFSASNSFWTASRGNQVINCELVMAAQGHAVLRCGYGSKAVIRSQVIASEDAATAVSETWKAALVLQGFRIEPANLPSC